MSQKIVVKEAEIIANDRTSSSIQLHRVELVSPTLHIIVFFIQ